MRIINIFPPKQNKTACSTCESKNSSGKNPNSDNVVSQFSTEDNQLEDITVNTS